MKLPPIPFAIILATAITGTGAGRQSSFPNLSDFTQSPTEHEIIVIDRAFRVRTVQGTVDFENEPGQHLPNVLFEIEGPGIVRIIRRATTDTDGRFKIKHVPEGTYKFKTTRDGFNSTVGTIVVSKKAPKGDEIRISVAVGT